MADQDRDPLLDPRNDDSPAPGKYVEAITAPVSAVGYLKKKNRWGFWQKRFFELDGIEIVYYKNKEKEKPRPALKLVGASLSGRFGEFDVETETRDLELRADNLGDAELWVEQIEKAEEAAEKKRENEKLKSKKTSIVGSPVEKPLIVIKNMEGYLEMPSGIRFKPWQDRFFRLKDASLFYYKDVSKAINDYEGEIPLLDPSSPAKTRIELTDTSNGRGFTIRVGNKEYKLKAPTADAAKDWIVSLELSVTAATMKPDDSTEEKSELPDGPMMVPKWIEEWDRESDADHVNRIQHHLDMLFPARTDGDYMKNTLNAVTILLEELDDKARECLPENGVPKAFTVTHRPSRPDIFEFIIRFFHIRIIDELSQFVSDQSYQNLSVRELLRFMDLITAYDSKIKEILQGQVGEAILVSLPRFDLLDNADNMALRYSRVCENQITMWVDNVIQEACYKGESRVFLRLDGRYQTPGPTDLFNLLDQALELGKVSGVKRLQAEIVSMCAVAFGLYVVEVSNDLVKRKADSLPLACATANDCWSIIEHVNKLESDSRSDNFKIDFEPVREKCAQGADRCLEALAAMVMVDLRPNLEILFTKEHLESVVAAEDAIAVACATMDDYLEDFQVLLEIQFEIRVARMMVRDIIGAYLARMAHAYAFDRRVALSKREVDLVKLDRSRIVNCMQGRLPSLDVSRIFATELQPLDDVIDMMISAPALIPATAMRMAERASSFAPYLRQYIINTAKMCVDLSVNGVGGNDKLVKEIKALVVTELEENVPAPPSSSISEERFDALERMALVRMWPQIKKPAVKRSEEKQVNLKQALKEETKITILETPQVKKPIAVQRAPSSHWQQFTKEGDTKPVQAVELNGPPLNVLAPIVSGILKFKGDAKQSQHIEYFCSVRPINETHSTDYEFVVFKGKSSSNPNVFRVRVSDIARVSYWDEGGAKHFGSNGKVVEDVIPLGVVAGKNTVDYTIAKNASEFVVVARNNDKVHLIAENTEVARTWVTKIRDAVEDSYEKWGVSFVEGQQEYSKMSISELKKLGLQRGLDMKGCTEKLDLIRVLKNNAPLLRTVEPSANAAKQEAPKPNVPAESPRAQDPQLTLNSSLFSSTKKEAPAQAQAAPASSAPPAAAAAAVPAVVVASARTVPVQTKDVGAPASMAPTVAAPQAKLNQTASLPANLSSGAARGPSKLPAAQATPPPIATPEKSVVLKKDNQPLLSKSNEPLLASTKKSDLPAAGRPVNGSANPSSAAASSKPALVPEPGTAQLGMGLSAQEEELLEVQSLIARGHMLIDENDPVQATRLFKRAKELADKLQSVQLRAKANAGLAASYRDQENMRRAAGTLFEVAAHFFQLSGDASDRLTCIREAADVFLRIGNKTDAIRVMETYDKSAKKAGQAQVFEARIKQLKESQ